MALGNVVVDALLPDTLCLQLKRGLCACFERKVMSGVTIVSRCCEGTGCCFRLCWMPKFWRRREQHCLSSGWERLICKVTVLAFGLLIVLVQENLL